MFQKHKFDLKTGYGFIFFLFDIIFVDSAVIGCDPNVIFGEPIS